MLSRHYRSKPAGLRTSDTSLPPLVKYSSACPTTTAWTKVSGPSTSSVPSADDVTSMESLLVGGTSVKPLDHAPAEYSPPNESLSFVRCFTNSFDTWILIYYKSNWSLITNPALMFCIMGVCTGRRSWYLWITCYKCKTKGYVSLTCVTKSVTYAMAAHITDNLNSHCAMSPIDHGEAPFLFTCLSGAHLHTRIGHDLDSLLIDAVAIRTDPSRILSAYHHN